MRKSAMAMNGLVEMIKTYLCAPKTDYAIMINGEWGCGKSYYVEHTLLPEIAKTSFASVAPADGEASEKGIRSWRHRRKKAKMRVENTFVGIGYNPESIAKAIAAAEKYREIFVS